LHNVAAAKVEEANVRDTLIALLFVIGIILGYRYFRAIDSLAPGISPGGTPMAKAGRSSTPSKTHNHNKGVQDGKGTADQSDAQAAQDRRENEDGAGNLAEASHLPSIYQEQEPEPESDPAGRVNDPESSGKAGKKAAKVVHGVPVQAYVLAQKDKVSTGTVPAEAPSGIRVFLQCMELKNHGPESLDQRDCQHLAFRGIRAGRGASNVQ
jgi:hypothetical protein